MKEKNRYFKYITKREETWLSGVGAERSGNNLMSLAISSQVAELEMETSQETETKRKETGCSRELEMRSKLIGFPEVEELKSTLCR